MEFKKYGPSRNLYNKSATYTAGAYTNLYTISGLDTSLSYTCSTSLARISGASAASIYLSQTTSASAATNGVWAGEEKTFTPNENGELYVLVRNTAAGGAPAVADDVIAGNITIMLNSGSSALPYEPYGNIWQPINPKQLKGIPYTGTLPAVLTGTKAGYLHKYKIYGNLEQTGTPTPSDPIYPSECGELETTGVHAGQYKLPLLSGSTPVDIYLGESQTTRRIKKLVLTGEESWSYYSTANAPFRLNLTEEIRVPLSTIVFWVCSHYEAVSNSASWASYDSCISWSTSDGRSGLRFRDIRYSNLDDFKAYIAQQYANGTPVTVWYVLATEETGTLNAPLRKIGNYADTIDSTQTSAQIPTTANSTTISWAGSGLAPSQFDSIQEWVDIPTYTYTNGEWVADN